jgi:hypothetical protein
MLKNCLTNFLRAKALKSMIRRLCKVMLCYYRRYNKSKSDFQRGLKNHPNLFTQEFAGIYRTWKYQ